MFEWLAGQFDEQTALIIYYLIIFVALIIAFIVLRWIWKGIRGGTFVHGGKDQRRLAVVDATAVDNRRRLVLVRRDNVEHLVMIGGMSDVLIESNIGGEPAPRYVEPEEISVDPPAPVRRKAAPPAAPAANEPRAADPVRAAPLTVAPETVEAPAPSVAPAEKPAPGQAPEAAPAPRHMDHRPVSAGAAGFAAAPSVSDYPVMRHAAPEPQVTDTAKAEPAFDVAQSSVDAPVSKNDDFDFDLDISANDIRTQMDENAFTQHQGAPKVDISGETDIRTGDNDESRKPLEDEMEELLNNLTGENKRP